MISDGRGSWFGVAVLRPVSGDLRTTKINEISEKAVEINCFPWFSMVGGRGSEVPFYKQSNEKQ